MPQVRTGQFTSGPNKGRFWEAYEDPASRTGWTRKIWDRDDPRRTEYFEPFNAGAAEVDEQADQVLRAATAARAATQAAERDDFVTRNTAYNNSQNRYRDIRTAEADRQFNVQQQEAVAARRDRMSQLREAMREQARQYNLTHELNLRTAAREDAQLGADILKTGAGMRGALDWAQGDMYAQGISQGGLSPFVQALRGGGNVPFGGGTATQGNPTPLTVGTLAARMTGGGGSGGGGGTDAYGRPRLSADVQAGVDAAGGVYEGGLANRGLGFLETMNPGQRDAFRSAGAYLGRDVDAEETYYRRSRPGQSSALRG